MTEVEDYNSFGIHFVNIENKNRSDNIDQIWTRIFASNGFFRKNNLPLQISKHIIRISASGVKFVYAIHFYIMFHITKPNIGLLLFKMPMRYQGRLG